MYLYTYANPMVFVDPTGEFGWQDVKVGIANGFIFVTGGARQLARQPRQGENGPKDLQQRRTHMRWWRHHGAAMREGWIVGHWWRNQCSVVTNH